MTKQILSCLAILFAATACTNPYIDNVDQVEEKTITFNMFAHETTAMTRADDDANVNYLKVFDEFNDTIKIIEERDTTATGKANMLSQLSLTLPYGTHTLYFVAYAKKYASIDYDNKTITWDKNTAYLGNVYVEKKTIDVSSSATSIQSVTMLEKASMVRVTINDAFPDNLAYFKQSVSGLSWTLDLSTMKGASPQSFERKITIPASMKGKSGLSLDIYSFVPESGSIGTMSLDAYDATNTLIKSQTFTDVTVTAGYIENYKGLLFSNSQGFTLAVNSSWTTEERSY